MKLLLLAADFHYSILRGGRGKLSEVGLCDKFIHLTPIFLQTGREQKEGLVPQ